MAHKVKKTTTKLKHAHLKITCDRKAVHILEV